ncbi:MAG: hypothetical protein ABIR06_08380 [Cyclobacteriaceae bacterium]
MKSLTVLFFPILCFSLLRAQSPVEVPDQIKKQFGAGFMSASTVTRKSVPKSGRYEAHFMDGNDFKKAVYSNKGVFLFTETRLAPVQLPMQISKAMSTQFQGFDLEQISRVETLKEVILRIKI